MIHPVSREVYGTSPETNGKLSGTTTVLPICNAPASVPGFACITRSIVVSYIFAMEKKVSPAFTSCVIYPRKKGSRRFHCASFTAHFPLLPITFSTAAQVFGPKIPSSITCCPARCNASCRYCTQIPWSPGYNSFILFLPYSHSFYFMRIRQFCFHYANASATFSSVTSSFSSSRLFMLFKLIRSVDVLWSNADVVGGNTPATPRTINEVLIPTIRR